MDSATVPAIYVQRLNDYLAGGTVRPLLALFDKEATVERYVYGEPPRIYSGLEQIEESLLRLPPVGGTFHISKVHVEEDAIHARFYTRNFAYPLSGFYRFELTERGQIARLYTAARYSRKHRQSR